MSLGSPVVMVSSTYYDLRQVRDDLRRFLVDQIGYRPMLSEMNSFPIDPDQETVENCRRRVEHNADVLVLIIGGRYGYVDPASAKSVTNLEYLAARAKGIPIYVFLDKKILSLLPVWQMNKSSDFAAAVDDIRIFDFVDQIRNVDKVWTHEFETAADITETLRMQFAYLMEGGLKTRLAMQQLTKDARPLSTLKGMSLRYALEKPRCWEYLMFAAILTEQIEKCGDLRRDCEIGIALGVGDVININQLADWSRSRIGELNRLVTNISLLVNDTLPKAFGPPGTPGDPELISFAGRRLGEVYRATLNWSQGIRCVVAEEGLAPVLDEMCRFGDDIVRRLGELGPKMRAGVEHALALPKGEPTTLDLSFALKIDNIDRFQAAMAVATREILGRRAGRT